MYMGIIKSLKLDGNGDGDGINLLAPQKDRAECHGWSNIITQVWKIPNFVYRMAWCDVVK